MDITLYSVSAFTDHGNGGNIAGVVLNAEHLSDSDKQKVANFAGYSETAFVHTIKNETSDVDFSVSFFTPTEEVAFCGHATLALFYLLYKLQRVPTGDYQFFAKAVIFPVTIAPDGDVTVRQLSPQILASFPAQKIAPLLNLSTEILQTNLPIEVVSTGLSDLIIPLPQGVLDSIHPNLSLIKKFCLAHNIIGFHLFELNDEGDNISASCRNFAPLVGINEESATGSACGALACYLNKHLGEKEFLFQQGRSMDESSLIQATVLVTGEEITSIVVGGSAKLITSEVVTL